MKTKICNTFNYRKKRSEAGNNYNKSTIHFIRNNINAIKQKKKI